MSDRQPFDLKAYVQDIAARPCFICGLARNDPAFFHHRIFEDDETIIFLSKYPTLPGYCLVCPKEHLEDLAQDISTDEYLRLQEKVHLLSRALKSTFDAERIYVLSLGSQQANSHVHFHVVPLPSGMPLEEQQYHALMAEHGILQIPDDEMAEMARRVTAAYHSEIADRC
ncbi:HIT family protein [Rhizobium bangladeshense]|uniref:HIT family protein n=1 Tax=Rhizobium bangladeshense TaxID=1138189 RepID=UPI0007E5684A|nr:HIT family protein [Rhizobium bangladeshense]